MLDGDILNGIQLNTSAEFTKIVGIRFYADNLAALPNALMKNQCQVTDVGPHINDNVILPDHAPQQIAF
jgi:hypothetical protein